MPDFAVADPQNLLALRGDDEPHVGAGEDHQVHRFPAPEHQLPQAKALAGEEDRGTPDELDAAFAGTCEAVRDCLPRLWRDRWWRMYDRDPISTWVDRRLALIGDAAHPMLQYLAQGACQAIEDADTLAGFAAKHPGDWDTALARYAAVRTARKARVQRTARSWGDLWHCNGLFRSVCNELLRHRDPADYRHIDWLYEG